MANRQYTVASTAQLVGAPADERYFNEVRAMDHANREKSRIKRKAEIKKGVRVPTTSLRNEGVQEDSSPGTDIFTHSRHASWNSSSPTTAIPESLPKTPVEEEPIPLLQPVAYTPPADKTETERSKATSSNDNQISVKARVKEFESQNDPHDPSPTSSGQDEALINDSEASAHIRSPSGESTSSTKRRGRRSDGSEIYFTPTDYTKSKIFLSSPQNSPTLPDGEDATTPTASTTTSRPSSEIYIGPKRIQSLRTKRKEKLKITPEQLDQLVTALAKAPMIQKDVRKHWWDVDDIPDDETVSSFSAVSIPTLTSASTLYSSFYSHPNEHLPSASKPTPSANQPSTRKTTSTPPLPTTFSGISLADPKTHGSPIRYASTTHPLPPGTCSFVQVPYGVDVECTLRVEPLPATRTSRIILQCVNQVVDRKTGTKVSLLVVDEDVTEVVKKAALAEFATFTKTPSSSIECVASPTAPSPFSSPEIDWIAIADDLQLTSETNALIESSLPYFRNLTPEKAHMKTHTLLSSLERIKDQHLDFLILQPTTFHDNGIPQTIRVPWVSQRLWKDWYAEGKGVGDGKAAGRFKEEVVGAVAKNGGEGEVFTTSVKWEEERLVVRCVPLGDGGRGTVWACFVRGMFDI